MHPVKKQILLKLSTSTQINFTGLKPKNIESNLFLYHLKQLINDNIVQKNKNGKYELSKDGIILMSKTSRASFKVREQPLIFNMIVCKNKDNKYLLYKRLRQPFLGLISFPYGKLHVGETLLESAQREFKEKTGLEADLKFSGSVYKIIRKDSLITHVLFNIFKGTNLKGDLLKQGANWECFWGDLNKSKSKEYNPGTFEIIELLGKNQRKIFFKEYTYND